MKITFKILALTFLLCAAFLNAEAQRGDWNSDPEQRAEQQTARMKEQLSLSDKQAEKVKAINLKYANKMKETRDANTGDDWQAMRETIMKLRQEQDEELKGVLTTEQFENWQKIREEQRQQRGSRGERSGKDKKTAPKQDKKS